MHTFRPYRRLLMHRKRARTTEGRPPLTGFTVSSKDVRLGRRGPSYNHAADVAPFVPLPQVYRIHVIGTQYLEM
jgi:hypothetical protein